jgi:cob(I)alamin adenosyltransferase
MVKIYTKTGDRGETGLTGGGRVLKNSARICAYGEVDELNAALGLCRSFNKDRFLGEILHSLQRDLFDLGADLSTPLQSKVPVPRIKPAQVTRLEKWIDAIDKKLAPLHNFILPGGGKAAAHLHLARTICRRAERSIVALQKKEKINDETVKYINRLSDLLFMMARYSCLSEKIDEEKWSGNAR